MLPSVLRVGGLLPSYSFIFSSYFFRIWARKEGEGADFKRRPRKFHIYPRGGAQKVPRRYMISRNFPHLSSRLAPRFGWFRVIFFHIPSYFLHISSYLIHTLSYLHHTSSAFESGRRGRRGQISREGSRKFHIYLRSRTRNFSKSHGGLCLVGIFQKP